MKTNASSTASVWGIRRLICPCEVISKITYGGSNLQLSVYKLHKRGQQLFSNFMATKFTLVLLSKIISKIKYSKSCILYRITYTTIEALLYQPLRFILTFKSKRSVFSFGGSIANMTYILYTFMHPFYALHLSLSVMAKTTAQSVLRTIDSLNVSINHYRQPVLCFYMISYLCVMPLFSV